MNFFKFVFVRGCTFIGLIPYFLYFIQLKLSRPTRFIVVCVYRFNCPIRPVCQLHRQMTSFPIDHPIGVVSSGVL
ncbi:hypothetical protein Hanom_Chr07g00647071 [Helianthus anomalus]